MLLQATVQAGYHPLCHKTILLAPTEKSCCCSSLSKNQAFGDKGFTLGCPSAKTVLGTSLGITQCSCTPAGAAQSRQHEANISWQPPEFCQQVVTCWTRSDYAAQCGHYFAPKIHTSPKNRCPRRNHLDQHTL